jgi:hypothetical protein
MANVHGGKVSKKIGVQHAHGQRASLGVFYLSIDVLSRTWELKNEKLENLLEPSWTPSVQFLAPPLGMNFDCAPSLLRMHRRAQCAVPVLANTVS